MMDSTCDLINKVMSTDSLGFPKATETKTTVFCEVKSVNRNEYFEAGKAGLTPAYQFTINSIEYGGQNELEYSGVRYGIYRTYSTGDYTELYVEYKGGLTDG